MYSRTGGTDQPAEAPTAPAQDRSNPPSYTSVDLFRGQKEILIDHQGCCYRLRITRTGGMILNK